MSLVTHQQARGAAKRLINSHFNNMGEQAVTRIPAQPDDDDILIHRYIDQQEAAHQALTHPQPESQNKE